MNATTVLLTMPLTTEGKVGLIVTVFELAVACLIWHIPDPYVVYGRWFRRKDTTSADNELNDLEIAPRISDKPPVPDEPPVLPPLVSTT